MAAGVIATLVTSQASAALINFDQSGATSPSGTISYDGRGGPAFGQGIGFDELSITGATVPSGHQSTLKCVGCALSFNTGLNTQEGPSTWQFNSLASSFSLTGEVYATDATGAATGNAIVNGTLFSGMFTGSQFAFGGPGRGTDGSLFFAANGENSQNSASLLSYFGLPDDAQFLFADTLISIKNLLFGKDGSFSGDVTGADINESLVPTDVPTPSATGMLLLGLLLVGAGALRRRRVQASPPVEGCLPV